MTYNLLKGKKGIIFGALDEKSIAWQIALKAYEEGAEFTLSNTPIGMRYGTIDELAKVCNTIVIPADATNVNDLEQVFIQPMKLLIVPSFIRAAGDVPFASLVCQHDAVFLHRLQYYSNIGGCAVRYHVRPFQPEPCAHGWQIQKVVVSCKIWHRVSCRPDVTLGGVERREANRVVERARGNLVITDKAWQNWKARKVGRCPSAGSQIIRREIPDCARTGGPLAPVK